VALTDDEGDTVEVYDYSVYGRVAALDASHPNRFLFTGRRHDKETGLYYYRARYYKPEIGRFLQVDPLGYKAGMNLYRYCGNNPWNMSDPLGNEPCEPCEPCAPGGRYVYPIDDQDAADPNGCYQTLLNRLHYLQTNRLRDCVGSAGGVFNEQTSACIVGCFGFLVAGPLAYGGCVLGCLGASALIDTAVFSASIDAWQRDVDDAYEHYNFCMCKFNKDGTTAQCAKKYLSDPCDPWWARWFSI
jgi:RHS repeat-associated protein